MSEIEINSYTKVIQNQTVLDHVSLAIDKGEVCGFVGRNGSGKTMLFRAVAGLIQPTSGSVRIQNTLIHPKATYPASIGIVLENIGLWPQYTGKENLKMLAAIKKQATEQHICQALERVGLDPGDKRIYGKYSLGMKQRLAIAQAIMEAPDLLLLDEPTNGLDEEGMALLYRIIWQEKSRGATILLASHSKEDINALCGNVYLMAAGRIQQRLIGGIL